MENLVMESVWGGGGGGAPLAHTPPPPFQILGTGLTVAPRCELYGYKAVFYTLCA